MKKVLLVTFDFYPKIGGVANYYFNLCRNLETGKLVVLTDGESIKQKPDQVIDFKIYRKNLLSRWLWPHWLPMLWYIYKIAKKEKTELLWVGDILPTGTAVYLLTKIFKLPYIISCHGRDLLLAGWEARKEKLARLILAKAKYVTTNSQYTAGVVKGFGIVEEKIKIVYPGIKSEIRNQKSSPPICQIDNSSEWKAGQPKAENQEIKDEITRKYNLSSKRVLLSVGRLVARKGFGKVIGVLPRILKETPDLVYVIVGDGPDRQRLEELSRNQEIKKSKNQEIEKRVIFLGAVDDEEKWAWLDLCEVFIMATSETKTDVEGFGIVYLEAALAGKPVIAGQSGGASEAVVNGQTGILVNAENEQEIIDAVNKLFQDEELAEKLGRQGKMRVEEDFNWEKQARKLKKLVE